MPTIGVKGMKAVHEGHCYCSVSFGQFAFKKHLHLINIAYVPITHLLTVTRAKVRPVWHSLLKRSKFKIRDSFFILP